MRIVTTEGVLADAVWHRPSERLDALARSAVLVGGFALLTGVLAQLQVHLPFTPVPVTGQTLAVLLAGGVLGARDGAASQAVYWLLGLLGLPFYAGGGHGWEQATGATLGYFVGFVVAAAVIGHLAQRRLDRSISSSMAAMPLGSLIIYVCGATWLAHSLGIPIADGERNAISLGVTPFLVGDLVKLAVAGALLPLAWQGVSRVRGLE